MTGAFTVQQLSSLWSYYLFHAFWQASLTGIAAIILVKTCKFLPSNVRHGVLIVALLKFAVPFLPPLSIGMFNIISVAGGSLPALNSIPDLTNRTANNSWLLLLFAIYVLGSLVAAFNLRRQQRWLNSIRRQGIEVSSGELFEEFLALAKAMKFKRVPVLITSAKTTVPFAYGLKTGIIVLPSIAVERLSLDELRPVLAHELSHLRHWDQWINWVQALLGAVWWFNPVYHLLSKIVREVREECRDDAVLAAGLASSSSYSCSMLAVAALAHRQPQPNIALHSLGNHPHPLATRLVRIADVGILRRERLTTPQLFLLVLVALFILPGLALKGASLAEESTGTAEKRFIHTHGSDSHQDHQQTHRSNHRHH